MRKSGWMPVTTTPLSDASSGTSNVIPRTSSALSFHRLISIGPLATRENEMAESAALPTFPAIVDVREREVSSPTASSASAPSKPMFVPSMYSVRPVEELAVGFPAYGPLA